MQKGTTKYTKVTKKAVATDETPMKHGNKGRKSLLRKQAFADVQCRG
jgi:hypothetical protein